MEFKNGDKIQFLEDCNYCTKGEIIRTGSSYIGGIELNGKIIDTITNSNELNYFWEYIKKHGYTEHDNFIIPKDKIVTIENIYEIHNNCMLNIDNNLRIDFMLEFLVESKEDKEDGIIIKKINK